MGATKVQSRHESRTVFVTNSYCDSESVLVHATEQDCKNPGRVVSKVLDESRIVSMMKVLNAAKAPMRIVRILQMPEPSYQCSTIWKKIAVSSLGLHQVSLSVLLVRSPKEFSGPAENK